MPKSKDNSAVEFLLDRINDLTRRVVALEDRQYPTFSSITNTPTVTRAEMTAYWASIADMYQDRLDNIQRQLNNLTAPRQFIPEDEVPTNMNMTFRIWEDGNLYIDQWDEWANN